MTQSLARNSLQVPLAEFITATKAFRRRRSWFKLALLAFEGGFLSIESGEATAVMRAEGEWHGRAWFSPDILHALARVPPSHDPLPITYADGHLLIGSMTIPCQWNKVSRLFIHDLPNPGLVDLLALERTMPRAEILGTGLGKKIKSAREKAERRIKNAAAQLEDLEVLEEEIRALVEARIATRLESDNDHEQ